MWLSANKAKIVKPCGSNLYLEILSMVTLAALAISFITFTAIAILIDVKKKVFNDEINVRNFTEFLIYFPLL